ncbi:MAG: hypothetical protein AAF458_20495 [Pseudomonadota bacterium]
MSDPNARPTHRYSLGDWLGLGVLLLVIWLAWTGDGGDMTVAESARAVFSPERIVSPSPGG